MLDLECVINKSEDRLETEPGLARERSCENLLIQVCTERSQMTERHIEKFNDLISKQKMLIDLNGTGDPVQLREAKLLLINLQELRELYEDTPHDCRTG